MSEEPRQTEDVGDDGARGETEGRPDKLRKDRPGGPAPGAPPAQGKSQTFFFVALLLGVLLVIVAFSTEGNESPAVEHNRYKVRDLLLAEKLDPSTLEFIVDTRTFRAKLKKPEGSVHSVSVQFETDDEVSRFREETFGQLAKEKGQDAAYLDWKVKPSNTLFWQVVIAILPWVLIILVVYFLFFRQLRGGGPGGNVLGFGKSRAKLATKEQSTVTFEDVAGITEAKEDVTEIIEFLKNPKRFQRLGGRMPRGVLLVGSPGTGKTLLAKAIAGEAGVPFFSISGSDFVEMFVGVGAARVRDLFKQARQNSPCIIFLDEVDAVGRRRGTGLGGGHDEREQTLNAILVEMDGFDSDEGIIVLAATNRPDVLDPALLRPGRFDREVVIDLPDIKGREEILRVHSRNVKMDESVDIRRIARGTASFSGAELAALVNESAIIAVMHDREAIMEQDMEEARDKIRWGRQKRSRVLPEDDKKITAYHEAGHAVVALLLEDVEPLHKVTIIPRGMALGATMQLPERDRLHMARNRMLANITVLYAGRISEKVFCGDITTGAANDIERASDLVRRMVCEWGMSDAVGPINYADNEETLFLGREVTRSQNHSESLAQRIDEEVRRIVDGCYQEAKDLIEKHRDVVVRVAEALIAKETLSGDEVGRLVAGDEPGSSGESS